MTEAASVKCPRSVLSPLTPVSVIPLSLGTSSFLPTGCDRALDTPPREQQRGSLPGDCLCEPASPQPVAFKDRPIASAICLRDKLFNGARAGSREDDKF